MYNMSNYPSSSDIIEQTNERISSRNIPSSMLQPYLDVRPVQTKYVHLPIVDIKPVQKTPLVQPPLYSVNQTFNPGTRKSPWCGFTENVNVESELRGQKYALQKSDQAVYVPSSKSDLYSYKFENNMNQQQQFPQLFTPQTFPVFNPNPENIGNDFFNNNTRVQSQNLSPN
jgi:hypothetical protein